MFIQFDKDGNGVLKPLPAKHVDTGAGFERFCAILQDVPSNYDTDVFKPIISHLAHLTGAPYSQSVDGIPHRVIADHIRCLTFAIADGVMPSNEGRGYVLRRILRRASRFARKLDTHKPLLFRLVEPVVESLGDVFPEIAEKRKHCEMVIRAEEEAFGKTLDRGLEIYGGIITDLKKSESTAILGSEAFRLYDTYGFPLDLTEMMAREDDLTVDTRGFEQEMELQKDRARKSQKFGDAGGAMIDDRFLTITTGKSSEFIGYEQLTSDSVIRKWYREGNQVQLTLDRTPFYPESGGQVGDQGQIVGQGFTIEIDDTVWAGDEILHIGRLIQGKIPDRPDPKVYASVHRERRQSIQRNHTMTHLLQAALRKLYGMHVHQAGSLVHPDYLRFDYTHVQKATDEDIEEVERQINEWVQTNIPLNIRHTTFTEAKRQGVIAIFGEKSGEEVRVVEVPGVSKELCGGCHVRATGDIGLVKIRSETAAAAGIRRIDAVTGIGAIHWIQEQSRTLAKIQEALQSYGSDPYEKLLKVLEERRALEHDIKILKSTHAAKSADSMVDHVLEFQGIRYVCEIKSVASMDDLKHIGDLVRERLGNGVGIIGAVIDGRPAVVCVATPDLIQAGVDVVKVAKAIGKRMGGGGGGKPHLATAGGKDPALLQSILQHCEDIFREVGLGRRS